MLEAINAQQATLISKIWREQKHIPEYQLPGMPASRPSGQCLTDAPCISQHGNAALS